MCVCVRCGRSFQNVKSPCRMQPPLQPFRKHTIPLAGNSSKALTGEDPRRARPRSCSAEPPAGVQLNWAVIGLSQWLAGFPMCATAVGRPRGTIWNSVIPSSPGRPFTAVAIESTDVSQPCHSVHSSTVSEEQFTASSNYIFGECGLFFQFDKCSFFPTEKINGEGFMESGTWSRLSV